MSSVTMIGLTTLATRKIPDPLRAHGARVYLLLSILTGILCAAQDGRGAAISVGLAFAGLFIVGAACAASDRRRAWERGLIGGLLVALGYGGAIVWQAQSAWMVYALVGLFPAALGAFRALHQGFLSAPALGFSVAALATTAPAIACAGGVAPIQALPILLGLAPFFAWRTLRLRRLLTAHAVVGRSAMRRAGWYEALWSLAWTAVVVGGLHLFV